jgi:hypothetical protein
MARKLRTFFERIAVVIAVAVAVILNGPSKAQNTLPVCPLIATGFSRSETGTGQFSNENKTKTIQLIATRGG